MSGAPAFSAARSGAWIHYALADADTAAPVERCIAWLAPEGDSPDVVMTLAGTWRAGGVYVFLGRPAPSDRTLLSSLRAWLAGAPGGTRLVWIDDASTPPSTWTAQGVRVMKATEAGGSLLAGVALGTGGYAVALDRGCGITLRDGTPAFSFGADGSGSPRLEVPAGDPIPLDGGASLTLRGPAAGALSFSLDVGGPGAGTDPLEPLDAGIRYYHPSAATSPTGRARRSDVGAIRYPVLDLRERSVTLRGIMDPADPLSERSTLAFAPETGALASHFRTVKGRGLTLTPLEGAGFRFAPLGPGAGDGAERLTLGPVGPFSVGTGDAPADLLCGLSGVEYVRIPAGDVTLRFAPGCPAWAPLFDPGGAPTDEAAVAPRLGPGAVTSWVALSGPEPLGYYAQPRDAVFHGASADGLLDYFAVRAGALPADGEADDGAALPLVPYAGVDAPSAGVAAAFEVEVLAPERRERVYGLTRAAGPRVTSGAVAGNGDDTVTAVTPGGWVATFSADREAWRSLVLARLGDARISLDDVEDPLRSALLTSDQFLVVSDPASLAAHLDAHARIAVDGWTFDLHPREWARHGTILILKSCHRPLAELVDDVGTWVLPDAFNRSPAATQRELEAIIEDARSRAGSGDGDGPDGGDPWRAFVREVVDDPSWSGWIALRCPVPPGSLPPDLRDLASGIDESRFFAHHLGIHQTPVPPPGQPPTDSALFGLIAYDDAPRHEPGRDHAFQVTSVHVAFAASAVRSFSARIALTVGRIFGAAARLRHSGAPPVLLLEGALQHRGERDVYVFRNASETTLDVDDRVLSSVRITRCELGSPGGAPGGDGGEDDEVVARFTLGGSLAFHPLPARAGGTLDLFGYDVLPFSGLALEMRFPVDAPRNTRFRLDVSDVAFDASPAVVRAGSLPDRFPLRPRGVASSDSAARPGDLGWSTVGVPDLDAAGPSGEWFGLVFDLDLGTPGALADAAGLSAGLALVWSPSPRGAAAMVGLRLPGASHGSAGVSLMGVLALSVHRQRLLAVDGGYLLELTGMTLRFLGKALPPDGTFDVLLFGDPDGSAGAGPLGWYGAYRRPRDEEPPDDDRLTASGRTRAPAAGRAAPAAAAVAGLPERGGEGAPPPAWWGRPWAWTLIPSTEDGE